MRVHPLLYSLLLLPQYFKFLTKCPSSFGSACIMEFETSKEWPDECAGWCTIEMLDVSLNGQRKQIIWTARKLQLQSQKKGKEQMVSPRNREEVAVLFKHSKPALCEVLIFTNPDSN